MSGGGRVLFAVVAGLKIVIGSPFGLTLRGDTSIEEAYALVPLLKARCKSGGGQLSGGEQRMLAVARALMGRPKLLLPAEPLEGLALVICDMLTGVFARLALGFADRGVILEGGVGLAGAAVPDPREDVSCGRDRPVMEVAPSALRVGPRSWSPRCRPPLP